MWFINEDGVPYEYDDVAQQTVEYPNDDHTPYATEEEARESADTSPHIYQVEVVFEVELPESEQEDDAQREVASLLWKMVNPHLPKNVNWEIWPEGVGER